MYFLRVLAFFLVSIGLLASCSKRETVLTADELQVAKHAISPSEVSLMLRGGYKQNAIAAEIGRRHITKRMDASTELNLREAGANPELLGTLKDAKNILSPAQLEAYEQFVSESANRKQTEASARLHDAYENQAEEERERQRKQALFQQSLHNSRNNQYKEATYQQADAAYRARKQSLETQIAAQETYINRLRSNGYRESDLNVATATLERYKEQLALLSPPLR